MTFLLNLLIGFSTILLVSSIEDTSLQETFSWVLAGAPGNKPGGGCCDSSNGVNDCPPGSVPCNKSNAQISTPTSTTTPGSVVSNNFSFLT